MAFRRAAYWKSMVKGLQHRSSLSMSSSFTTSTRPKLKAYAPTAGHTHPSSGGTKSKFRKGDFMPVFMAVGMISMATGFGLFTAWHQLGHGPNLYVKKSRRETVPEVVEPEHVAEEAHKFLNHSFFRKVAHIQDFDRREVMPDPIHADIFARGRAAKVETLRSVGVDPAAGGP